jgi:DNA-binding transcriptional regulator of glucitol operon
VRRFLTLRWLCWHVAVVVLVAAFLGLGWWQVDRARGGNALSYGYAIEWPVFALFVIFVWSREIRAELRGRRDDPPPPSEIPADLRISVPTRPVAEAPDDDPEVRAYNDYLAWLAAHPQARPSDYRSRS